MDEIETCDRCGRVETDSTCVCIRKDSRPPVPGGSFVHRKDDVVVLTSEEVPGWSLEVPPAQDSDTVTLISPVGERTEYIWSTTDGGFYYPGGGPLVEGEIVDTLSDLVFGY